MKDAYSFDIDEAGLDASYAKHDQVYHNIFSRCGLDAIGVEATLDRWVDLNRKSSWSSRMPAKIS